MDNSSKTSYSSLDSINLASAKNMTVLIFQNLSPQGSHYLVTSNRVGLILFSVVLKKMLEE